MEKLKIWVSWSTGKDCAYALQKLRADPHVDVLGLLTTLNASTRSVAMHGTPEVLLKKQAEELNLPLHFAEVGSRSPSSGFEEQMKCLIKKAHEENVSHIAFGDLFLKDVRARREEKMKGTGIDLLFPLWNTPTDLLARNMIESGIKAVIVSVDLKVLPASFLGRTFDEELLKELPSNVDPCGENGEFHTFVYESPLFSQPVPFELRTISIEGEYAHQLLLATPGL